jgi:glycosyltransferase involved in cell wall biosynthesis
MFADLESSSMPSIIIPANNEEAHLGACLNALLQQSYSGEAEVIVSSNASTDDTVAVAESWRDRIERRGWALSVINRKAPGKPGALNAADEVARFGTRIYIDADVICMPKMVHQLVVALDIGQPKYASGTLRIAPTETWVTRQFGRTWERLPFVCGDVPGAGLFAVNAAGRARWDSFPEIIADDLFARLHFAPEERVCVSEEYFWPLSEGFANLIRVRRRQDAGNRELFLKYPYVVQNESKRPLSIRDHLDLFCGRPVSYLVYVAISLAVRYGARGDNSGWARGR